MRNHVCNVDLVSIRGGSIVVQHSGLSVNNQSPVFLCSGEEVWNADLI